MLAYNFNDKGEYIGSEEMMPDPLEPNHYLQPANSTLVSPPAFDDETSICRWSGKLWTVEKIAEPEEPVEPEPAPEDLIRSEIAKLKSDLAANDYKIIKTVEYSAVGVAAPYDIAELHASRETIRAKINALQEQQVASNASE